MSAEERRGALPHPAQLAEALLRRAVGDTAQHLVQSGKSSRPVATASVQSRSRTLSGVLTKTLRACGAGTRQLT